MLKIQSVNLSGFVIDFNLSLIDAIRLIETNNRKAVIVLRSGCFYGVLSDGDVRKSLLHGISTNVSVSQFTNRNPICLRNIDSINDLNTQLVHNLFSDNPWITLLPIINSCNQLIAVSYLA